MRPLTLALTLTATAAAGDLWELPPTRYADTPATDPIAMLATDLASGNRALTGTTPLDRLRTVLRLLEIPAESQILVFSKTSKQNNLISMSPAPVRCRTSATAPSSPPPTARRPSPPPPFRPSRAGSTPPATSAPPVTSGSEIAPHLSPQERTRIDEILRATVPGYR